MIDSLPDGLSGDEVAELMGAAASRAAGYEVLVEATDRSRTFIRIQKS